PETETERPFWPEPAVSAKRAVSRRNLHTVEKIPPLERAPLPAIFSSELAWALHIISLMRSARSEERRVGKGCRSWWCSESSSRRRHTRFSRDWSSDVCSSDLAGDGDGKTLLARGGDREPYPGDQDTGDRGRFPRPQPHDRGCTHARTVRPAAHKVSLRSRSSETEIGRASCRERVEKEGG